MTNHTMPALTDSERKELVEYLTACVENRCVIMPISDTLRLDRLRNQIALSSLNAPAMGRVNRGEVSDSNDYPDARVECLHEQADWENFQDGYLLYPMPPVPALKLPGRQPESGDDSCTYPSEGSWDDAFSRGFNACIAEVKNLNGVTE